MMIDLECLDGLNTFRLGQKMVTCAQYVKARPCSCYDEDAVINNCCLSCKTVGKWPTLFFLSIYVLYTESLVYVNN